MGLSVHTSADLTLFRCQFPPVQMGMLSNPQDLAFLHVNYGEGKDKRPRLQKAGAWAVGATNASWWKATMERAADGGRVAIPLPASSGSSTEGGSAGGTRVPIFLKNAAKNGEREGEQDVRVDREAVEGSLEALASAAQQFARDGVVLLTTVDAGEWVTGWVNEEVIE